MGRTLEDVELPTNPRVPAWIITPKEEKLLWERWRTNANQHCDAFVRAYIECSNSYRNPLDGIKYCKEANAQREACLRQFQKMKTLDEYKDAYIQEKIEMRQMVDDYVRKRDAK